MKIDILNFTPESLSNFLEILTNNLPNEIYPTPLTIELSFAKIEVNYDTSNMTVTPYDYYDETGKPAEFEIEDSHLLDDNITKSQDILTVNDISYKLKPSSTLDHKKTPR